MSRFSDYDYYEGEPEQILACGRWEHNSRRALKSKRGRKALAELREALMALPEHKLISGALCTVGGVDQRLPALPDADTATDAGRYAHFMHKDREYDRRALEAKGEGVCAIGAYAWYRKVKAGMDPAEAFASLPTVFDGDQDGGGDQLAATAKVGEDAGMTFTLAWNLAYRNDEHYPDMTPEQRWERFIAWIDKELASAA